MYELLGGPVRDRIRLYWSHCGIYRLAWSKEMQIPPLRTLDDVRKAAREVVHLATMMNAHVCAVVPNFRIMEIDPDTVPWYDDLVTVKPVFKDGHLHLPTGPGWGTGERSGGARPPAQEALNAIWN